MINLESLLVTELNTIKELKGDIYPLSVPEKVKPPYVAYCQSGGEFDKTLDGFGENNEYTYEVNVLTESYPELKSLTKRVVDIIKNFKEIKEIQDIDIESPIEKFEDNIKLYRANISYTVYL